MFKKILLAADGSKHSMRAMEKAIFIAKKMDGTITLIHVIDDIPGRTDIMDEDLNNITVPVHQRERTASIEKKLNEENVNLEVLHVYGEPGPSIIRTANKENFDLVVIGSRGLNPFQEMVLGSVSHKVSKRVECPVLIVK